MRTLLAAACGLAAVGAYWQYTAHDRLVAKAIRGPVEDEDWTKLRAKPKAGGLAEAIATEILDAASKTTSPSECAGSLGRLNRRVGPLLKQAPTSDDRSLRGIARLVVTCTAPEPETWTTRPPGDFVGALHTDIGRLQGSRPDGVTDFLIKHSLPTSADMVDIVVASTKAKTSKVDGLIALGFPRSNEPFRFGSIGLPATSDPRVGHGVSLWLAASGARGGLTQDEAVAMLRVLENISAPTLEETSVKALGASSSVEDDTFLQLCTKLIRAADEAAVRSHLSGARQEACLKPALKQKEADELVRQAVAGGEGSEEDVQKLIGLGRSAIPALRAAMSHGDPKARAFAARTLVRIDPSEYATTLLANLEQGVATADDAHLAGALLQNERLNADLWVGVLATGRKELIEATREVLKLRPRGEPWFAEVLTRLNPQNVAKRETLLAYVAIARETEGIGPSAAAYLERQLKTFGGSPARLYWLTKMLALEAILAHGTKAEAATATKLVGDAATYEVPVVGDAGAGAKPTFGSLATKAVAAASAR